MTTTAASRSSVPSSSSTGMPKTASSRCRSRFSPAATASPCSARSRRRKKRPAPGCSRSAAARSCSIRSAPAASPWCSIVSRSAAATSGAKQRFVVDEGDIGNTSVGIAMSGSLDLAGGNPRLAAGLAGTRMPIDAHETAVAGLHHAEGARLVQRAPRQRHARTHRDRGELADSKISKIAARRFPTTAFPSRRLAIGCVVRPVNGLPALRDADLTVHIVGRDAVVSIGRATADTPSGRKLTFTSGVFEVPDTSPHAPPARVHFKMEGPGPGRGRAACAWTACAMCRTLPFEPSAMHGNLSAQVSLGMPLKADLPPGSTNYSISLETTNFAAERMIMGQKVEAAVLRATANSARLPAQGRRQDRRRSDEP